jgi:hypothetical protein
MPFEPPKAPKITWASSLDQREGKRLRVFFKYKRRLLGDLCRCALRSLTRYFEVVTGSALTPGVIAAIQTFGDRINLHALCGAPHKGGS